MLAAVRAAAAKHGIWVHLGSLALRGEGERNVNRGFVIDDQGAIRARYDKIHLFDVDLPTGESWRESAAYAGGDARGGGRDAGRQPRPVDLLRSALPRPLSRAQRRRRDHVERARRRSPCRPGRRTGKSCCARGRSRRALFVVAAAQSGTHEDGRATYGHSLVVDPWGKVLLDMGEASRTRFRRARPGAGRRGAPPASRARPSPRDRRAGTDDMIVFDLKCSPQGHVFEAWFGSTEDYESQRARGLVACPLCETLSVEKARDGAARRRQGEQQRRGRGRATPRRCSPGSARCSANCSPRRTMSATASPTRRARSISARPTRARSTAGRRRAETASLLDEGIPIAPLPLPVVDPADEN